MCAWVDVSDTLHPESAAAIGVDLSRLLWIRCGGAHGTAPKPQSAERGLRVTDKPPKAKTGLPQGGGGHPRMEVKGLSAAVSDLLSSAVTAPRCAEALHKPRPEPKQPGPQLTPFPSQTGLAKRRLERKSWSRLEQGLRVADLLLQAGGFSCIVLDMGSLSAEYALRVPLATWFRFRAAAERLQSHVVLLTQHACSRNSAGLVLRLDPGSMRNDDSTIFTGLEHRAELARQRFPQDNVLPLRSTAGRQPAGSRRKTSRVHIGKPEPFGQDPDENDDCTLRMPRCKRISTAGSVALKARTAAQTGGCAGWRTAVRTSVLAQQCGTDFGNSTRHDKTGNGDVPYRRDFASFARGGGSGTSSLAGVCRDLFTAGGRSEQ